MELVNWDEIYLMTHFEIIKINVNRFFKFFVLRNASIHCIICAYILFCFILLCIFELQHAIFFYEYFWLNLTVTK